MSENKVDLLFENEIAIVTLNNPPVNALDKVLIDELDKVVKELKMKEGLRAVIITGAGEKAFVAGADISQFPNLNRELGIPFVRKQQMLFQEISDLYCPVICALNGHALGGGLELALACDIRIASVKAKFGVPEVSLGIIPGLGGTQRLPRLITVGYAKKMIFSGEAIDAQEAYRIGLVEKIVEHEHVLKEALKLAEVISKKGPLGVAKAKVTINKGLELNVCEGLLLEANNFGDLCETNDKNEGAVAFFEKRAPEFKGN
ncbi:enoyl-CoA hydratase [Alkalibaculum sp. M08DMB]|uniref:short-chain-enoyl-CoA hydratase n=1 Tax=Alkalibaculum sporogenes TaxID=2655001 RepID=A0A6A7KAF5_9FIRM|nr:enoyl-CoA hydratase-related protein [Alkalibaculum sporogenes]MPW26529.1 enoyl-CoA hydratase [Alkalibaculum sporogenes]